MCVLAYGLALFGTAFVLHLLVWRLRLPKRQTATLLVLFLGFLVIGSCIVFQCSGLFAQWGLPPLAGPPDYVQVWLFYLACAFAYIAVYSGLAADSPSLVMIMEIAAAGSGGLSRESLLARASDRILIEPRLRDLVADRVVDFDGRCYRLRPKGSRLARLFTFYREVVMRRPERGG